MAKIRELWNKFKTGESLCELQFEVEKQLERARKCVTECTHIVDELSSFLKNKDCLSPKLGKCS